MTDEDDEDHRPEWAKASKYDVIKLIWLIRLATSYNTRKMIIIMRGEPLLMASGVTVLNI